MMGGTGPKAVGVMWAMCGLSLPFVALRFYTRRWVLYSVGLDDYIYSVAWLFMTLFTAFATVAATYGFGQSVYALPPDDAARAIFYEMVGQTFSIVGMAVAKVSLAIFMLRLVVIKWHRWFLWASIALLSLSSIACATMVWAQCVPAASIWDHRIKGECIPGNTEVSIYLGALYVTSDFVFAGFPWLFLWGLNMRKQEKMTIAGSLSLGVISGICSIFRVIALTSLSSGDYTRDTVELCILTAASESVTLICIGIPHLRPLYRRVIRPRLLGSEGAYYIDQSKGSASGGGGGGSRSEQQREREQRDSHAFRLSHMRRGAAQQHHQGGGSNSNKRFSQQQRNHHHRRDPYLDETTIADHPGGSLTTITVPGDGSSSKSILGDEWSHAIRVTDEVNVHEERRGRGGISPV